jgi:thymidylate kinase
MCDKPLAAVDAALGAQHSPVVHPVLESAFRVLDACDIRWSLIRGADDLAEPTGDVDLLVDVAALDRLDPALAEAGLVRMGVRGHGSHRFYFSYDAADRYWLKLDVVTEISFGQYQQLRTTLAGPCLERRRRDRSLWRLAPEDEAWLFLLHLFLDKRRLAPERRQAALTAARQASVTDPVALAVDDAVGEGWAQAVLAVILHRQQDFGAVARRLSRRWTSRRPMRTAGRWLANGFVRHLDVPFGGHPAGPVVAFIGPDGAGKTTVSKAVDSWYPGSSRRVHLGIWREARWDALLHRVPGVRPAQRVLRVLGSSAKTRFHRRLGRLVLLDRSVHDVFLPGSVGTTLSARVVPWLLVQLAPRPGLILLLDAPGELMFARKGENTVEVLEERRQAYLDLARRDGDFVVLDAASPAEDVAREAVSAIWRRLGATTRDEGGAARRSK